MTSRDSHPAITPVPTISGDWPIIPDTLRLVRKIGQGGMAKVYKAVQDPLEREVALKILAFPTSENVARFQREGRIMAGINHENIVGIYDMYRSDSRIYMIMELVEGVDLGQLLEDKEPFPPALASAIMLKVARALEYIQARGIIHRDIKPGNIMISFEGQIKIMDFGIAKDLRADSPEDEPGSGVGTPTYMSPEQLRGEYQDGRSDIYSLGIVFYRLLTGSQPFVYRSQDTLFTKIVGALPLAPRNLLPTIPPELEDIVMKCISKNMKDRYENAALLQRDLENYIRRYNPVMNFNAQFIRLLTARGFMDSNSAESRLENLEKAGYTLEIKYPGSFSWKNLLTGSLLLLLVLQAFFIAYLIFLR